MSPPPSSSASAANPDMTDKALEQPPHVASGDNALVGIGLILASCFFFSLGDTFAKLMTDTLPALEVTWLRNLVFCLVVIPSILFTRGPQGLATARTKLQVLRGLAAMGSGVLFILSIGSLPIAEATAIHFVSPIFITALSIPLLGEKVGIRRWSAAIVGFAGVLIIVQPGSGAFNAAALLTLASAMSWAFAAIATRQMSHEHSDTTLAWSSIIGLVGLGLFLPFDWKTPNLYEIWLTLVMGIFSAAAHWLTIMAYRRAPVSIIAPFSYAQILFAGLAGFVILGAIPGLWTFVGGALIAASGLYTAHRERVRAVADREAAKNRSMMGSSRIGHSRQGE